MCVCVFGLLCSEAMGHIRSGGSSRDACALIFPASINLSRGVFEENSLFVLIVYCCGLYLGEVHAEASLAEPLSLWVWII